MQNVNYFRPESLQQAIEFAAKHENATLWAGGTDLVIKLENNRLAVSDIVDLKGIKQLRYIEDGDQVRIGSLSTIYDLESSELIKNEFPLLAEAAHVIGSWQIRTLATVGGNLVNAAPSADTATPMLVIGGTVVVEGFNGERKVPIEQFFTGPGKTCLTNGEIVKEIILPKMPSATKGIYLKHGVRKSMDIALVGVACALNLQGATCVEARLGLGAVAPTPMRAKATEALLTGEKLTEQLIDKAAKAAAAECQPICDIRASESYRRELVQILVRRALTSLWKAGEV